MFSKEQVEQLKAPLSREAVRSRQQGNAQVSYIETYHAENEANRIFGFDAWDRETELTLIGEPRITQDRNGKDQFRVAYRAKVRITVRAPDGGVVVREGCGFGSGIDKDVDQAHESALKEAESDAEKRALKTFGNPFGQALYDKEQKAVASAGADEFFKMMEGLVSAEADVASLSKLWQANAKEFNSRLTSDEYAKMIDVFKVRRDAIEAAAKAKADLDVNPFGEDQ